MHMSLSTEFEVGDGKKEDTARFELVQTHDDAVEIRVRHEIVASLDRDQLAHLGAMIAKMMLHLGEIAKLAQPSKESGR